MAFFSHKGSPYGAETDSTWISIGTHHLVRFIALSDVWKYYLLTTPTLLWLGASKAPSPLQSCFNLVVTILIYLIIICWCWCRWSTAIPAQQSLNLAKLWTLWTSVIRTLKQASSPTISLGESWKALKFIGSKTFETLTTSLVSIWVSLKKLSTLLTSKFSDKNSQASFLPNHPSRCLENISSPKPFRVSKHLDTQIISLGFNQTIIKIVTSWLI